jgi:hypothetical protein
MRFAIVFFLLLVLSAAVPAQSQPDLIWEGEITSSATLYIQGDRVDVQGRGTGAVDRPRARFRSPLPRTGQADISVRTGTGRVTISEHPSAANEYTLIVDIDNRGSAPQYYVVDFFWQNQRGQSEDRRRRAESREPSNRRNEQGNSAGSVSWSGEVDHEAIVTLRGQRANARRVQGKPVEGDYARFTTPLPRREVAVRLVQAEGRGKVELIEQPNAANNYSARVRILDNEGGSGSYNFTLSWEGTAYASTGNPAYRGSEGILTPDGSLAENRASDVSGDKVQWSGGVDGTVRVFVRGNRIWAERVSGQPVSDERAAVGSYLPGRNVQDIKIDKLQGRGDVRIVQRPARNNNYTLAFEIEDDDAGSDHYLIEATWRP